MTTQQLIKWPQGGAKSLLVTLIAVGALAACNSSGSSSSDDDDNGNGNGNGDSVTGITDADSVLVYEEADFHSGERQLLAVDIDDPNARSEVSPKAQDNLRARDESSPVWVYSASAFTTPDDSNVPLGVLGGDFSNGELTNAGYHYTVYNTPDGELYRLDANGGDTTAERFSTEDDASVICASFVAPDLADIDNSHLIYQVAKDTSCEDTEIRMARIGDDDSGDVVTLHENVAAGDSFQTLEFAEMGGWLTDSDGALVEVITYDGSDILAYDLVSDSSTTLQTGNNHFAVLGYTDHGSAIVFAADSGDVMTYEAGGSSADALTVGGSAWSTAVQRNSSHAVAVDGKLYVVDSTENAVVEVDGTDATPLDVSGWTSSASPGAVMAADNYLAFAYSSGGDWHIRQVALDGSSADHIVENIDSANFPITSPKAPGSNGSYWFLYTDFSDDDPVARGVEFTGGGGEFSVNDALWRGEAWARTVGETGYQAEYLFYQESDQEGDLFSLDASDPANSSGQNMEVGDLTWGIWVSGFGPETLMAGREDQVLQDNRPEVLYIDASDAGSAVRLTDEAVDHRPVPFY